MLPAQRNKIDISSLSEEEQKMFRLYGKLPNRKDLLNSKLKERKYFDSGDYALSKAGKAPQNAVGTAIPNPQIIAHASTVAATGAASSTSPPNNSSSGVPSTPTGVPIASSPTSGVHAPHVPSSLGSGSQTIPAGGVGLVSTSPTASTLGGGTGRPAHPQVSTFPIGSSSSGASISPTGSSHLGAASEGNAASIEAPRHLQAGFPNAGALSPSPAKEGSSLARTEISADDLMEE